MFFKIGGKQIKKFVKDCRREWLKTCGFQYRSEDKINHELFARVYLTMISQEFQQEKNACPCQGSHRSVFLKSVTFQKKNSWYVYEQSQEEVA